MVTSFVFTNISLSSSEFFDLVMSKETQSVSYLLDFKILQSWLICIGFSLDTVLLDTSHVQTILQRAKPQDRSNLKKLANLQLNQDLSSLKWFALLKVGLVFVTKFLDKKASLWYHEETQTYDRKCTNTFQMNNGSLYTSELGHEFD